MYRIPFSLILIISYSMLLSGIEIFFPTQIPIDRAEKIVSKV